MSQADALFETDLPHLKLLNRGKVRDIFDIDEGHMLIVASDRLSAFDVVLPQPIPGKGEVLTPGSQLLVRAHPLHPAQSPV